MTIVLHMESFIGSAATALFHSGFSLGSLKFWSKSNLLPDFFLALFFATSIAYRSIIMWLFVSITLHFSPFVHFIIGVNLEKRNAKERWRKSEKHNKTYLT